jgi:hypothetical protein
MRQRTPFVKVPLTQGKTALISPEDADVVRQHTWHAQRGQGSYRAMTSKRVNGKTVNTLLHRLILGLNEGDSIVDHKNGNPLDCRRGNIRLATFSQNTQNSRKRNASPYRGTYRHGKKWQALIMCHKRARYLGVFATPEEAAHAYDTAARELFGEFACVNFPHDGERRAW